MIERLHHRLRLNLILLLILLLLGVTQGRDADDRSRLLYAEDPAASIILEYQLHNAPSEDYSGDERLRASKEQPGSEYDEEKHIRPYFLRSSENLGPRVVQYYSPWCGHCQYFKRTYIALAKEVNQRLPDDQPEITFHAVSCSLYHWVCMQGNVKSYPTIVAYKADSVIPQPLEEKKLTAESIAEALDVQLITLDEMNNDLVSEFYENGEEFRSVDILGATLNSYARTRDTVYKDAALSFTHALKTGIFTTTTKDGGQTSSGPLNSVQREVFSNWIDLLYWSLPPTWILHTLINDIRNNIDSVMASEENLLIMVAKHQDVVNGDNMKWSTQCNKSDERAGYSCGLWSLFHIVSIGVIERHRAVLGARDQVTTKFVAKTVRDYVEHFFDCEVCREYYIEMFDNCGFKHCRRFRQPQKLPPPESWTEFATWLWEVHNDVNLKVMQAESHRNNDKKHKFESSAWPTVDECPTCKDDKGKWNMDAVLGHLKKVYWPAGVQNFRFAVLKKKESKKEEKSIMSDLIENLFFFCLAAVTVMWCSRKQYIIFSGRHKKMDHDYV